MFIGEGGGQETFWKTHEKLWLTVPGKWTYSLIVKMLHIISRTFMNPMKFIYSPLTEVRVSSLSNWENGDATKQSEQSVETPNLSNHRQNSLLTSKLIYSTSPFKYPQILKLNLSATGQSFFPQPCSSSHFSNSIKTPSPSSLASAIFFSIALEHSYFLLPKPVKHQFMLFLTPLLSVPTITYHEYNEAF